MKMETINISLPPAMASFVRQETERNYGNASEFFRDLVRLKMRREIEEDLAFLKDSSAGAPAGPSEAEIARIVSIQKRVRKELHARRV
ncbi:MAG: type II toxin-antitoxin system ParD family antitoxin [Verrucomicrobia bacterium]|nr:type II toxin-antitoxin system ParD family antitoxin [Verrucomicrobiota bacterium]